MERGKVMLSIVLNWNVNNWYKTHEIYKYRYKIQIDLETGIRTHVFPGTAFWYSNSNEHD